MRVLFVSHDNGFGGGANRSMMQLIIELQRDYKIQPIVLIPWGNLVKGDTGLEKECINYNIPVLKTIVPWFRHNKVWLHRIKYIGMWIHFPILINKLKKMRIDIVHSNGSVTDIGRIIANSLHVPHIWHLREFGTENVAYKPVWGEMYCNKTYRHGDVFIAISEAIKQSYSSVIQPHKLIKIYNGICKDSYNDTALHNNDKVQFVVVGQVAPHKNQLEALKAIHILRQKGIDNFRLNIIGSSIESYKIELDAFIHTNRLTDYVIFWGLQSCIPKILVQMDIGLMLSKSEAFGRVTVEYMFQSLAVIATNTGANPELINDGVTGILYNYGNEQELADKMEYFIKTPSLIKTMGEKSKIYAIENFSSSRNTAAVYEVYETLIKSTIVL